MANNWETVGIAERNGDGHLFRFKEANSGKHVTVQVSKDAYAILQNEALKYVGVPLLNATRSFVIKFLNESFEGGLSIAGNPVLPISAERANELIGKNQEKI